MNTGIAVKKLPISRIIVQDSCPVCAAVKNFQESFLEHLPVQKGAGLCNVRAWSVTRSASAEVAAALLLLMLKSEDWNVNSPFPCIACKSIHEEEQSRLNEAAQELNGGAHGPWIRQHSKFCIRHLIGVKQCLPLDVQKSLEGNAFKPALELEQELEGFLQHAKQGNHAGGGVLGRTAQFLVAQRGILD